MGVQQANEAGGRQQLMREYSEPGEVTYHRGNGRASATAERDGGRSGRARPLKYFNKLNTNSQHLSYNSDQ